MTAILLLLFVYVFTVTQSTKAFVLNISSANSKKYSWKHHPFIVKSSHHPITSHISVRRFSEHKVAAASSSTSLEALLSSSTISMLVDAACIGAGAVAGSLCRWQVGSLVNRAIETQPRWAYYQGWHTAGINVLGSFILGSLAGVPTVDSAAASIENHRGITARTRLMAGVGFCGAFTTFSTFSVDVVAMLTKGEMGRALSYMAVNNLGGVFAAFTGFSLARRIIGKGK